MSEYFSNVVLTLGLMAAFTSVDASSPEDWGAFAASQAVVKRVNTGKMTPADLHALSNKATLNQTSAALPKVKMAMAETSSQEIPPPPPPMGESYMWVEPRATEPRTSSAALGSSGMLRREASVVQKSQKSVDVNGVGKLRPHKFSRRQDDSEVNDSSDDVDDPSSHPTAADLGGAQMHLLENIDEEEEAKDHDIVDPRNLLVTRMQHRASSCHKFTKDGQKGCDKAPKFHCGWRQVNEESGNQPYCADCSELQQTDCISAQDKGNSKCVWSTTAGSCSEPSKTSSLQQTRKSASLVQQQRQQVIDAMHRVKSAEKLRKPLPWDAVLNDDASESHNPTTAEHKWPTPEQKSGSPESMAQANYIRGINEKEPTPMWYHAGHKPEAHDLKFEYQSAIGRDGYEPDPLEPAAEFFGPFKLDYNTHSIILNNWNLHLGTKLPRYGMGNLIVGNNQTYDQARNGVVLGDSNKLKGSYGLVSGQYNFAKGRGSVVDGGSFNKAAADYSTVAGGENNNVTAIFSVVQGGQWNSATQPFATVGGGEFNLADGYSATVQGGKHNMALANLSSVTGGAENMIPPLMVSQTIAGGRKGNIPTSPPNEELTIEPGEAPQGEPSTGVELDFGKLGCKNAEECEVEEQDEKEEDEEGDEHGNPAMKTRVVKGGNEIDEDGSIRRRRTNAHEQEHHHLEGMHQFDVPLESL